VKEAPHLADKWELPGGGIDHGEDPREALVREIKEELNLEVTYVSKQPIYVWTNRFEGCRGMDWYYSLVLGYKMELANFEFTPTEDIVEIGFFDKSELPALDLYHQSHRLREIFNPADFVGK
jgi:8-oxo-dGTP diphosphatase